MTNLIRVVAHGETLLIDSDGAVHGAFSLYLNSRFTNPHTREVVSDSLRILHRFLMVYKIDLPQRAMEGTFLTEAEIKRLSRLVKLELKDIESMHDRMIERRAGINPTRRLPSRDGFVAKNTAALRLHWIVGFFRWYRQNILDDGVRSVSTRQLLDSSYTNGTNDLEKRANSSKQGHHNKIRSLPSERYLSIMREVLINPERLFVNGHGGISSTWRRDRAISLLAIEGMRPGAIGNLIRGDYEFDPREGCGYITIKDNLPRRGQHATTNTPVAKGVNNASYMSEIKIKLWPTTCTAIEDYLQERAGRLEKMVVNKSRSFLFLGEHGEPISNRSTISAVFKRLAQQLGRNGFLDRVVGDPYVTEMYEFSAYTLRHSAASFFYEFNKDLSNVEDLMRLRFGWTARSSMPKRYANRSMSQHAGILMNDFFESLKKEVLERRFRVIS